MAEPDQQPRAGDITPRPDPTILTSQQLFREILTLKEGFNDKIEALRRRVDVGEENLQDKLENSEIARKEALDKFEGALQRALAEAEVRTSEKLVAAREQMTAQVTNLRDLHQEKFESVDGQFAERDVRSDKLAIAAETAVGAALQAAKEAVEKQNQSSSTAIAKSEAATDKRIDQLGVLINTTAAASDAKIGDLKERVTRLEGHGGGMSQMWGIVVAAIGLIVAIAAIAAPMLRAR